MKHRSPTGASSSISDPQSKIIDAGIEKAYLPDNEVTDLIPHDVNSAEGVDDLLATYFDR